jgi:hypothetical protein
LTFSEPIDPNSTVDTFNFTISPTLSVNGVMANADGSSVTLTTEMQAEDTLYNVTVTAGTVTDLAGNAITSTGNKAQFRSWTTKGCNGLTFEAYTTGVPAANNIAVLTNNAAFLANNPRLRTHITKFDSREVYPDDSNEGYAARVSGLFIPDVPGQWVFFLRSDDASELWLNPTGPSRAGRVLIAKETGCCNGYLDPGAAQTSQPQTLQAGHAYYIEALYQEGTGGDYVRVAARLAGTGTPPTAGNTAPDPEVISDALLGSPASPVSAAGVITISQQPAAQSVQEHTPLVTFSVTALNPNSANLCYQWQRNDGAGFNDIPGANSSSYSIRFPTQADDNGDKYRVIIDGPGISLTSAEAALAVTPDTISPAVVCVLSTSPGSLVVYFSEPIDPNSVESFNFAVDQGISVQSAVVSPANFLRVDLTLDPAKPMTLGNSYQVTVYGPASSPGAGGVKDPAGNPLRPDPTVVHVNAQNYPDDPDGLITLPTNTRLALGALTTRGFKGRLVQITPNIANDNTLTEQLLGGTYLNPATGTPYPNIAPQPTFTETGVINYNRDAPGGASVGHLTPDVQFPGYPPGPTTPEAVQNNIAMEVLTYVELKAGIHRWVVASDDGFRVTPALSVSDPNNSIVLGEFNGGRGVADSTFNFIVKQDGLYPMRLIWEQGQGGANLEWEKVDLNTGVDVFVGINEDSIKAYQPPAGLCNLSITLNGTSVTIKFCGILEDANDVTGPWNPVTPPPVDQYTIPATAAKKFYRSRAP